MTKRNIAGLDRRTLLEHEKDLMETLVNSLTGPEQKAVVSIVCDDKEALVTSSDGTCWSLVNDDEGWWCTD